MEVRDKLCANIYGEDQLWEDLRREEQIDIDGKAELWARSGLNSVIDKVLEAEGRAKVAAGSRRSRPPRPRVQVAVRGLRQLRR